MIHPCRPRPANMDSRWDAPAVRTCGNAITGGADPSRSLHRAAASRPRHPPSSLCSSSPPLRHVLIHSLLILDPFRSFQSFTASRPPSVLPSPSRPAMDVANRDDQAPDHAAVQEAPRKCSSPAWRSSHKRHRLPGTLPDHSGDDTKIDVNRTKPAPRLSYGSVSLAGRRREMEDAVTVAPPSFASVLDCDFFGVYDGHGGVRVAHACRDRMHVVLAEEAAAAGEGKWKEAMMASFARVDGEVSAADVVEAAARNKTVGSTAVVAVVGPRSIVVANCGDSRAVLSRAGVPLPLSSDHKPDRPDELERVEAAGGKVINWEGCRVLGVLATSRSIGDYYLKPYVIAEPEVTVTDRTEKDEFLILGSDGLWDVVSNEVACKLVRQCLSGRAAKMFPGIVCGHSAAEAAGLLAELAMSLGSEDNTSVVVVELKKLGRKAR